MCAKHVTAPTPGLADLRDIYFRTDVSALDSKARSKLKRVINQIVADEDVA